MESRKEFINRMMWMVREIESSKFNTLESLPMLELELKMRDVKLIKNIKSIISNFISLDNRKSKYFKKTMKDTSIKLEIKINDIIRKLE
jgi:hypothetical protein